MSERILCDNLTSEDSLTLKRLVLNFTVLVKDLLFPFLLLTCKMLKVT